MRTGANRASVQAVGESLYAAIGAFLDRHHLSPDPRNYAFAHQILSDPAGPLARAVGAMGDRGLRLTARDVAMLTADVPPPGAEDDTSPIAELAGRVGEQMQVFGQLIDRMQAQTSDFGRELAAGAEALGPLAPPELVQLTAAMLIRVRHAEAQIAAADGEAAALRAQLAAARGDARTDSLTGLPNRRALLEDFAAAAADARPMCLALCDIDHFKRINDRFGHPVGDRVLCALAGVLAEACGTALVARYGGEEFAVLFTNSDIRRAGETLDRARAVVATKTYRRRDDNTPLGSVTFSAGAVEVRPTETFDDALARADCLLYAAKTAGRNQICS